MTATNHTLTGVVIGSVVASPYLALPIAFVSHFVLDWLPHYDSKDNNHTSRRFLYTLSLDIAIASAILLSIIIISPNNYVLLVASAVIAASADLMWFQPWVNEIRGVTNKPPGKLKKFHSDIQKRTGPKMIYVEIAWACLMITILAVLAI